MPPSASRTSMASAAGTAAQRRGPDLPPYQPMDKPLTAKAMRALTTLLTQHSMRALGERIEQAAAALSSTVVELNENQATNEITYSKSRSKFEKQNEKNDTVDEAEQKRLDRVKEDLEIMRPRVERLTQQMDENVRKMIDDKQNLQFLSESVEEARAMIAQGAGVGQAPQNQAPSQRRRPLRNSDGEIDDDDDNESEQGRFQDFTPTVGGPTQATGPGSQPSVPPTPTALFKAALERKRDRYQSSSLYERYASNNDYKRFKRDLHESHYPDGVPPPMAPERTWFQEGSVPQPGTTARAAVENGDEDEDDDEDLAIARENISTKCPLTLQEFRDPVTSTKCPHSFEREAMMEMIEGPQNAMRVGSGRNAPKAVQCPVPGCSSILTTADVVEDLAIKRKIVRLQRAARRAEEEAADAGDGPEEISSGDEHGRELGDEEEEERDVRIKRLKSERRSVRP